MDRYVIRKNAQNDLENIWLYSVEAWGLTQADTYIRRLLNRIEWLSQYPQAGKRRDEIKAGYFSYREVSHSIFYKTHKTHIEIIGVLHKSMDVESFFQ